jgi:hypothetical protein
VESVLSQHSSKPSNGDQPSGREWQPARSAPAIHRPTKPAEQARPASLISKTSKVADSPQPGQSSGASSGYQATDSTEQTVLSEPLKMDDPADLNYLTAHWKDFINAMRGEGSGGNLDARLRHACEPVEINGENLVLGFYHEFHKNYIDNRKYLHLIEKKLKEVFGHDYTVSCVMMPQGQQTDLKPASSNHLVEAALSMGAKIVEEKAETEET